jgi:hypothetical protein
MTEPDAPHQTESPVREPAAARSRAQRFVRAAAINGALLSLSVALSLLLAEVAIRVVAPQQLVVMRPDLWVPRDSLGYWNRPGVRTVVNTGERPALIVTDAEGYRVAGSGRVEGDQTVLLLGDSFMKALQVDHEQSLAGRMESALAQAVGRKVGVRNAGVDGWDPNQYLAFARSALERERVDVVVVALYVGNDVVSERVASRPPLAPVIRRGFHVPRSLSRGALVDATARPLNDALEQRSHFYVFAKSRASSLLMRLGLTGADFPREIQRDFAASPGWEVTGDICADLAAMAASHGAATVFVLIPSSYQVHRDQFITFARGFGLDTTQVDLDQPNRLLGAALRQRGLTIVDPLDSLRAAARAGQQLFGSVDRHLSPAGHALIERALRPAVTSALAERAIRPAPLRELRSRPAPRLVGPAPASVITAPSGD